MKSGGISHLSVPSYCYMYCTAHLLGGAPMLVVIENDTDGLTCQVQK